MIAIVGLGNPGKEYENTRHNIGFSFLDYLANNLDLSWQKKFEGLYTKFNFENEKIHLLKPQTFMNLSGKSVLPMLSFFKLKPEETMVIYDDLDMSIGKVRIKTEGGSGGHNGIKSIDASIGNKYHKIKIGIGRPKLKEEVSNYVLQPFSTQEEKIMLALFEKFCKNIGYLVQKDFAGFLTNINLER